MPLTPRIKSLKKTFPSTQERRRIKLELREMSNVRPLLEQLKKLLSLLEKEKQNIRLANSSDRSAVDLWSAEGRFARKEAESRYQIVASMVMHQREEIMQHFDAIYEPCIQLDSAYGRVLHIERMKMLRSYKDECKEHRFILSGSTLSLFITEEHAFDERKENYILVADKLLLAHPPVPTPLDRAINQITRFFRQTPTPEQRGYAGILSDGTHQSQKDVIVELEKALQELSSNFLEEPQESFDEPTFLYS